MKAQQHSFWYHLVDVLFNIVVIVAIVFAIRTFLIAPFQVVGNSMLDTLTDKEYIIINKLAYYIGKPERGDVVVLRPPNTEDSTYYVKRVIGLPGDEVVIQEGQVFLRREGSKELLRLNENLYLTSRNAGKTFRHPPSSGDTTSITYKVPEDSYFVMGDNRQGSLDSRSFMTEDGKPVPFVSRQAIKGRVWFIALPLTKIHALEPPEYGF